MQVRTALAEKGIPYQSHQIDPSEKLPEFGGVPVALIDGERVVVESLSILEYLDEKWPEPPLFPARVGREVVKAACERLNAMFAPHLPRIAHGTPEERVQALGATRRSMADLDGEGAEGGYLLGELSAADLALASFLANLPRDWRPVQLGFQRLGRWELTVMSRPTVRDQMAGRVPV